MEDVMEKEMSSPLPTVLPTYPFMVFLPPRDMKLKDLSFLSMRIEEGTRGPFGMSTYRLKIKGSSWCLDLNIEKPCPLVNYTPTNVQLQPKRLSIPPTEKIQ